MVRVFFIIICSLLSSQIVMGQQIAGKERPVWVNGCHIDGNNSYVDVFWATGHSVDNARDKAVQKVIDGRSMATGQRVQVNKAHGDIVIKGYDDLTVKCRIVDEYYEYLSTGEYKVSLLVQTARNPEYGYETVSISDNYPFSGRAFVPGMAQLHKGSIVKGTSFIVGEIAAVGGIVAFECMRSSYDGKIKQTHDASLKKQYIAKVRTMSNIRNGFIAGAAAIYIWNVVDGIVAKGKSRVTIGDVAMNVSPYASTQSAGVALCFNF